MKPLSNRARFFPPSWLGGSLTAVAVGSVPLMFAAGSTAQPPASPAKTHVLFLGADIALENNRVPHRVEDVTATQVLIREEGKVVPVPLWRATNLNIRETLKLAETSVRLEKLSYEEAYTDGADPIVKLGQSIALAEGEAAVRDLARAEAIHARMGALGGGVSAEAAARVDSAEAQVNRLDSLMPLSMSDVGARSASMVGGNYDAIRFSFRFTADRDLQQPYYAVIAQIRDPGSAPGKVRKWTYLKSMDRLKAGETGKVAVLQGGMPPGFAIEQCEVHIYDAGEELATNLSRKRVDLTEQEAMDYRIFEHIGMNKNRTLPAELATTSLDGKTRFSLTKTQLEQTAYARVDPSGTVIAVFADEAGRKLVEDEALAATIRNLRFKPALQAGKPVESTAAINLSALKTR